MGQIGCLRRTKFCRILQGKAESMGFNGQERNHSTLGITLRLLQLTPKHGLLLNVHVLINEFKKESIPIISSQTRRR